MYLRVYMHACLLRCHNRRYHYFFRAKGSFKHIQVHTLPSGPRLEVSSRVRWLIHSWTAKSLEPHGSISILSLLLVACLVHMLIYTTRFRIRRLHFYYGEHRTNPLYIIRSLIHMSVRIQRSWLAIGEMCLKGYL